MLRGTIRLGRIFGIEIGLHFSWFIIAALLTMSLAAHVYSVNREWGQALIWTAAGVAALAFLRGYPASRVGTCGGRTCPGCSGAVDHVVRARRPRTYEPRHSRCAH
jgi:hypothetical protein